MPQVTIIDATKGYRQAHAQAAMDTHTAHPDRTVVLIGQGPLLKGRIETGDCWPCNTEGIPERLPAIWVWTGLDREVSDPRERVRGWTGLCNKHAKELHGVSIAEIP